MNSPANNNGIDIYMYGMVVQSTIHRLAGRFPELDTYGEIAESFRLPGGEAGNSATVLNKLCYRVKIDGPFLGARTLEPVTRFYDGIGVDCSGMEFDAGFDGVEDLVIVAEGTRTVFGTYGNYFFGRRLWSAPDEAAIAKAAIVGLDPFFYAESEEVARLCVRHAKPYVTIDCPPEGFMFRNAAAVVISNEYIQNKHRGEDLGTLFDRFAAQASGLVIFTFGGRDIMFGRRGANAQHIKPFHVEVKSTLGAGDTFRAGIMHGIVCGMDDLETVRFGAATAACVCRHFPVGLFPPSLDEITALMAEQPVQ
jgi:sugar/nucleoside kinase (ribokinase family)